MAKPKRKRVQMTPDAGVLLGRFGWESLGDDAINEVRQIASANSLPELRTMFNAEVSKEVQAISDAAEDFDAFDLIELMRMRELPVIPVLSLREGYDGSGAAIDLVSLVLLAREGRLVGRKVRAQANPGHAVSIMRPSAVRLLRLSSYVLLKEASLTDGDPAAAQLAAYYRTYMVAVRGMQYESVQHAHDEALFARPELDELLRNALSFTYRDFLAVRDAVSARYRRLATRARDESGDIVRRTRDEEREPTPDELEVFSRHLTDLIVRPAQRAAFRSEDIAEEASLPRPVVDAVLKTFSMGFDPNADPASAVGRFLRGGANPLGTTSLVRDADGNYVQTGNVIGADSFRTMIEAVLKPPEKPTKSEKTRWERYNRARKDASESLARSAVAKLLGTSPTYTSLEYFTSKEGEEARLLGADCEEPQRVGDQTEADALFLVEDVAICLEVKGRTITDQARRGDMARLQRDVDAIFGDGTRQTRRLETLIRTNGGIWLADRTWLDLSKIQEVRSMVVGLDIFGPLAVSLGELLRSGALGAGSVPWISSLHDLEVVSKVLDRPSEFLLYLRRRTDSGVTDHYRGADELDMLMLFLSGGLYVEPDPAETERHHPVVGTPRTRDLRRHARDARPTFVGTHTDPLDAWMYWVEGSSPYETEKPSLNAHPAALELVDFLADGHKPGWFRFGADILALSGKSQKDLGAHLTKVAKAAKADGQSHSYVQGFAGPWGYPTLFFLAKARDQTDEEGADELSTYMLAKRHQQKSDRSLGVLTDQTGAMRATIYINDPVADDPDLDRLGAEMGLFPAGSSNGPAPPSANRPTRRLRGARKRSNRRR
jgi:hypothetical protein